MSQACSSPSPAAAAAVPPLRAAALGLACLVLLAGPAAAAGAAGHGEPASRAAAPNPPAASSPRRADDGAALEALRQRLVEQVQASQNAPGGRTPVVKEPAGAVPTPAPVRPAARPAPAREARRAPAAAAAAGHGAGAPHWGYAGELGPAAWGELDPAWASCGTGQRQSPIDIRDGIRVDLEPIRFDYRPTSFRVLDNGHTVQAILPPGNAIQVGGRRYELLQFHFHRPSEERINGRQYAMDIHLVHRDPEGRLAVVAVLIEPGRAHPVIQQVWNHLPLERNEENPAQVLIDPAQLLPDDRRYLTYMGSLTTPPCSEGVLWMVLREPVAVAIDQISVFSRLYPMNARPVQPSHGRLVKESN